MTGPVCVVRGGGDLATGVVWRLYHAGCSVLVTELADPLTVRRTVALSAAVSAGTAEVEGLRARLVPSPADAHECWATGEIPVLVAPTLEGLADLNAEVVVDARLAKRCLDTDRAGAALVIGLGPGFSAGPDGNCDAVVETQRSPRLGRVLWTGSAAADTGRPEVVEGRGAERVLRAPMAGIVSWEVQIGDLVEPGAPLGMVDGAGICAPFRGVVRGLVRPGLDVAAGLKVGDIDPRLDVDVHAISDKALAVGGGVVEAVLGQLSGRRPVGA